MVPVVRLLSLLVAAVALGACADAADPVASDEAAASFGIGKADEGANGFSACELREVLAMVNESTATPDALKSKVELDRRATTAGDPR